MFKGVLYVGVFTVMKMCVDVSPSINLRKISYLIVDNGYFFHIVRKSEKESHICSCH